jgi:hypothetical protein
MIMKTDATLYAEFVEQYGEIMHAGISYALAGYPDLSNHVLPDHLDGYVEWTASAMDIYGNEYVIKWNFDATLSREIDDAGSLPWDKPSSVIPV